MATGAGFFDTDVLRVILEQNLALRVLGTIGADKSPDELRVSLDNVLNDMCTGLTGRVDELAVKSSRTAVSALLDERARARYGTGAQLEQWLAAADKWGNVLGETFYKQIDESLQWVTHRVNRGRDSVSAWAIVRVFQLALALGFVGKHMPGTEYRKDLDDRLRDVAERCRELVLKERMAPPPDLPPPDDPPPERLPADVLRAEFVIGFVAAAGLIVAMWFLC